MVLTGILRHYATVLMASSPKKLDKKALREQRALAHGISVRTNHHVLSRSSFTARRDALMTAFESGAYLKDPDARGQPPPNPMSDPNAMEGMMGMMKNQMAMIIPNTMIMGWINTFFSGYVISEFFLLMDESWVRLVVLTPRCLIIIVKLPFPLTIKFKSMLQAGVATKDMDPRWMSSISWYFLCFFGLQPVFNFLLGSDNGMYRPTSQHSPPAP